MFFVIQIVHVLSVIIFADVLLSWVVRSPQQFPRNYISQLTEPLYRPVHQVLDPRTTGGLDLAPLVWLIGLQVLASALGG